MSLVDGLRVLSFAPGIAGGYTAKLLGDAGADVVLVEPPMGDPLRHRSATGARPGGLFAFLHGGHLSVVGEPDDSQVGALAEEADLLLDGLGPKDGRARALRGEYPHLAVVSLSPFGLDVPGGDAPWTEFTLQALSGSTGSRGTRETPPTYAAGELIEWYAGSYAAPAALAAWREARDAGVGPHVDLSMLEAGCLVSQYATVMKQFFGIPEMPPRQRIVMIPCVEPTADGWVGFSTITGQQFQDFLVLIEAFEYLDDTEMASQAGRLARAGEIAPLIRRWTERHTTDEIIEKASALRIPVAPIGTGDTVATLPHFVERRTYADHPDGFVAPLPPWRIHGGGPDTAERRHRRSPALGEHDGQSWSTRPFVSVAEWTETTPEGNDEGTKPGLPLAGMRVLDFTMFWAGPAATHVLAALGADVVKVESTKRPDGMRFTSARGPETDRWWEWGWLFHGINTNKTGITLDLDTDDGRTIALRLVEQADVVIENYTPRVMDGFGLGWETIHVANPQAVMLRMPGFGLDGPWRDRPGWANTMEQVSGLAAVSGWPDSAPWIPNGQLDAVVGQHAAFLALAALEHRDRTGSGFLAELPMVEVGLSFAAEQVIECSAGGAPRERAGNHGPFAAPQGVYRCDAKESWIAVSVANDAQWGALVEWLGSPDWAVSDRLAGHDGRLARGDQLDEHLSAALATRDRDTAVVELRSLGVPAAAVINPTDLDALDAPAARGFAEAVEHRVAGRYDVPTVPYRWTGIDRWVRNAAPTLGRDNDAVLAALSIDADQQRLLRELGVVGDRPTAV